MTPLRHPKLSWLPLSVLEIIWQGIIRWLIGLPTIPSLFRNRSSPSFRLRIKPTDYHLWRRSPRRIRRKLSAITRRYSKKFRWTKWATPETEKAASLLTKSTNKRYKPTCGNTNRLSVSISGERILHTVLIKLRSCGFHPSLIKRK